MKQVVISYRQGQFAFVVTKVLSQKPAYRVNYLFLLDVILGHDERTGMIDVRRKSDYPGQGSRSVLFGLANLLRKVVFQANHFDQIQLSFSPIDAFF